MEDMKQPSSTMFGLVTANNLGFGSAVAEMTKFSPTSRQKEAHHGPNQLDRPVSTLRNITHWAHMEDMKQLSSTLLGLVTANNQTIVNSLASLTDASNAPSQATKAAVNATNNQANLAKASGSAGVNSPP
jgi:hypothetical protein